jgi:hypothetical protein
MHEMISTDDDDDPLAGSEPPPVPPEIARMYRAEALQYTYGGRTTPAAEPLGAPKDSMLRPLGLLVLATAIAAGYAATLRTPCFETVPAQLLPRSRGDSSSLDCAEWTADAMAPAALAARLNEGTKARIIAHGREGAWVEVVVSRLHWDASESLVHLELRLLGGPRCDLKPGRVSIELEVGDRPLLVPDSSGQPHDSNHGGAG